MRWTDARIRVLPALRTTTSPAEAWRQAGRDAARAVLRQRVAPFLHAVIVLDGPEGPVLVGRNHLAEWRVPAMEVFSAARWNLPPTRGLSRRDDGIWQISAREGASCLALPRWLAAFAGRVRGRPVAAVPDGGTVLVGGDRDAPLLLRLARERWRRGTPPVSPALYTVRDDGRVAPWIQPPGSSLAMDLENAQRVLARSEYERQRHLVRETWPALELAPTDLLEDPRSGRLLLISTWAEEGRPLLPVADVVVLHPRRGGTLWVHWTQLVATAGHRLGAPRALEPPRFPTLAWPSRSELARLRALAAGARKAPAA